MIHSPLVPVSPVHHHNFITSVRCSPLAPDMNLRSESPTEETSTPKQLWRTSQHSFHSTNSSASSVPMDPSVRSTSSQGTSQGTSSKNSSIDLERTSRPKRKRITPDQLQVLLSLFEQTDTPSYELRESVGAQLGMSNREVQVGGVDHRIYSFKALTRSYARPSRCGSRIDVQRRGLLDRGSRVALSSSSSSSRAWRWTPRPQPLHCPRRPFPSPCLPRPVLVHPPFQSASTLADAVQSAPAL